MYPRTLMTVENFTRHWKDKPIGEIKTALQQAIG
jgi:hypothetical protein